MITWLFTIALIVFISLPTLLVVILYRQRSSPDSPPASQRAWLTYCLLGVTILSLLFAALAFFSGRNGAGPQALAPLPALVGLLALLLINARLLPGYWQENKKLVLISAVAFLTALIATALTNQPSLVLVLILPPVLFAMLWNLVNRLNIAWTVLIAAALVVFLWVDALGLAAPHVMYANSTLRSAYKITSGLAVLLALVLAARFIYSIYKSDKSEPQHHWLYWSLAALLVLSVGAVTFRHGVLAHATGRAFEDHLPLVTLAVALIAGLVLALNLNPPARRAGIAFILLVPSILYIFYLLGWGVNAQAVTTARAQELESAIQEYRQETGAYPASLADLTPAYQPVILGPLTGRGQVWCYQSGADYYRLGYVYFQRYHEYPDDTPFWEPYYAIEIPSTAGQPPPGEWICDEELRLFKTHNGL